MIDGTERFVMKKEKFRQEEAELWFQNKIECWRFSRLLEELYRGERPLKEQLLIKMKEYDPKISTEQITRRVNNWLRDRNLPNNREELFKICFALGAEEYGADLILGITAESGIHYRNPRELIYAYCLRKKIDYPEAEKLVERLWKEKLPSTGTEYREYLRANSAGENRPYMTASIRDEFGRINTEKELEAFLEKKREQFGIHHNTAYRKFKKMLDCLVHPVSENPCLPDEQNYSVHRTVEEYLRMGVPYERRSGKYTKLQREIKRRWPSPKTIYEMSNRKTDVDRKTLLLLYLATEGYEGQNSGKRLPEHRRRIDLMMTECGFPVLNIHSPFDYLVLQAINQKDEEDFISIRMERILKRLFDEKKPVVYLTSEKY